MTRVLEPKFGETDLCHNEWLTVRVQCHTAIHKMDISIDLVRLTCVAFVTFILTGPHLWNIEI